MSIDITRAQIGRIYDYVLGGTFNYEADRSAAKKMVALMPAYPRWAYLNRAFLGHVGKRWAAEGRKLVLDLGSGLPTQGHFNEHMPDAKILFADKDPLSVVHGQQLLAYSPDMAYVEADLCRPDTLIEQAAVYFSGERQLAVGCIGVTYFLSDDEVRYLVRRLRDLCLPGSVMAVSFPTVPRDDEPRAAVAASAEAARTPFYSREPEEVAALLAPWRVTSIESLEALFGADAPPPTAPDHPLHQTRMTGLFAEL